MDHIPIQRQICNGPRLLEAELVGPSKAVGLNKPNKFKWWMAAKRVGLKRAKWVPRVNYKEMNNKNRRKAPSLNFLGEEVETIDEEEMGCVHLEARPRVNVAKCSLIEIEQDDVEDGEWLQSQEEQQNSVEEMVNWEDTEEELTDDMLSSEGEKERGYEFGTDSDSHDWLHQMFEGGEASSYEDNTRVRPNPEDTTKITQVVPNESSCLLSTEVFCSNSLSIPTPHCSDFFAERHLSSSLLNHSSTSSPKFHSPGKGGISSSKFLPPIAESGTPVASPIPIASWVGNPQENKASNSNIHTPDKNRLHDSNIQENLIIEHQKELNCSNKTNECHTKIASKEELEVCRRMGLTMEEWDKFSSLLNKMGMSLVPPQKKKKNTKTGSKGSSRKGVRELKGLKCDINYEREKGKSVSNRGDLGYQ